MMKYNHLQISRVTIAVVILSAIISTIGVMEQDIHYVDQWLDASDWDWKGVLIICFVYLVILNFSSLRIQVSKQELIWKFGIGIPRKKIALDDIESITVVRNHWWNGWGIRKLVSGGWLYNVSGLDAVEVKTSKGKIVRLGTDEPKKLAKSLLTVTKNDRTKKPHKEH